LEVTALIKKIHMYIGLLNFVTLTVFGIAGLTATFDSGPGRRNEALPARYQEFSAVPSASDKEVADQVFQTLNIPLSNPIPKGALRRNSENQLAFDFYTMNGIHRVTVLEKERRLRIEPAPNGLWHFLNNMHSVTIGNRSQYLRMRLWAWYNEFAIWSLIGMAISGAYLWLASRPAFRWAQISFAAGSAVFIGLYVATR
jgi:hypothetical protein